MGRRRKSKAASASAAGDSGLSAFRKQQVASEEEEGKILKLDSLMMLESEETLEDRQGKILILESEEDRNILMNTSPELNFPEDFQDDDGDEEYRNATMFVHMKLRDYHQALVDQYEKFGYAVDEKELSDDEDEDEDNTVKN